MEKKITAEYKFDFGDFRKMLFTAYGHMRFVRLFIGLGIFTFFMLLLNILMSGISTEDLMSYISPLIFISIFVAIFYFSAKRQFNSNTDLQNKIIYIFDNEKFVIEAKNSKTEIKWKSILKIIETKKWFLIFINKYVIQSIPKDGFEDVNAFKDFLITVEDIKDIKFKS